MRRKRYQWKLGTERLEDRRVLATLAGQVFEDLNGDGDINAGEAGLAGIHVFDDANGNGILDRFGSYAEPDDFADNEVISIDGMSFSVADANNNIIENLDVWSKTDAFASSGGKVFGHGRIGEGGVIEDDNSFFHHQRRLRIDFTNAVSSVSIDFVGSRPLATETGMLEAFDSAGESLGTYITNALLEGTKETMTIETDSPTIATVIAHTKFPEGQRGRLDNLRVDDAGSELWTITGPDGSFSFDDVGADRYDIDVVVPDGMEKTLPTGAANHTVGQDDVVTGIQFGLRTPARTWQNLINPIDIDGDGNVVPRDVILVINEINQPVYADEVTGLLPTPPDTLPDDANRAFFFDVNGDGFITAGDAVRIINFINSAGTAVAAQPAVSDQVVSNQGASDQIGAAIVDELASDDEELFGKRPATNNDATIVTPAVESRRVML
ncbi:MAG: hypothetical protein KDB27_11095 [Planctomycetales bacterium]|nr:hypothetical protein [Planctomycetales bacterium]